MVFLSVIYIAESHSQTTFRHPTLQMSYMHLYATLAGKYTLSLKTSVYFMASVAIIIGLTA